MRRSVWFDDEKAAAARLPEMDTCLGCGRCMISCADGGHQAIRLDETRRPRLNGQKCVGCHLCVLVCPQGAISSSRRRISRKK